MYIENSSSNYNSLFFIKRYLLWWKQLSLSWNLCFTATSAEKEILTLCNIIIKLFFSFTKWSCSLWACWTMWLACFFNAEIFSWRKKKKQTTIQMYIRHSRVFQSVLEREKKCYNLKHSDHISLMVGRQWLLPRDDEQFLWTDKLKAFLYLRPSDSKSISRTWKSTGNLVLEYKWIFGIILGDASWEKTMEFLI